VLVIRLGLEYFGLSVAAVRQIVGREKITPVPGTPDYVRGLVNLRGQLVPVVDLACRFGLQATGQGLRNAIVVVRASDMAVGLEVDRTCEVVHLDGDRSIEKVETVSEALAGLVAGLIVLDDRPVTILDLPALLSRLESEVLQAHPD
jgi:purine-binding chemotaxis protein CheW